MILSAVAAIGEENVLSIKELCSKIRDAADPDGFFRNAESYLIRQKITVIGGERGEFYGEIKFKKPDKIRSSYFYKGKLMSAVVINGGKAWNISGADGSASDISGIEFDRLKLFHQIANPSTALSDVFEDIRFEKTEENGESFYVLSCRTKLENIPAIVFYVGAKDFLQRRMISSDDKGNPYSAEIVKYSLIDRILIPSETKVLTGGVQQQIVLETFKINIDIDDSEFGIEQKQISK
jgi:outer membrane lipoprotein-sorting protein